MYYAFHFLRKTIIKSLELSPIFCLYFAPIRNQGSEFIIYPLTFQARGLNGLRDMDFIGIHTKIHKYLSMGSTQSVSYTTYTPQHGSIAKELIAMKVGAAPGSRYAVGMRTTAAWSRYILRSTPYTE